MYNFSTQSPSFSAHCTHQFSSSLKESELNYLFVLARSHTRTLPFTSSSSNLRQFSALFNGSNMKIRSRKVWTITCVFQDFTIEVSRMVILSAAVWGCAPFSNNSLWQPSSPFCSNGLLQINSQLVGKSCTCYSVLCQHYPHSQGLRSSNTTLSSQAGPSESQHYAILTGRTFGIPNTMLSSLAEPSESQYYAVLIGRAFGVPILR